MAQQYPPNSYGGQSGYHPSSPPTSPVYDNTGSYQQYPSGGYPANNYPPSSPTHNQNVYSPASPTMPMNYSQHRPSHHIPRPQSTVPHPAYPHSSSHSHSNSYSQSHSHHPSHMAQPLMDREIPGSHLYDSQSQGYGQQAPRYHEVPQIIGISSDYPVTSVKPFSCDLCSLSFNRQHDLKRHRETHTGDKPYLCNGGCGKTFTRKDALKRHQVSSHFFSLADIHTLSNNMVSSLSRNAEIQKSEKRPPSPHFEVAVLLFIDFYFYFLDV